MSAHGEDEQSYRGMTGKGKQFKIELYDPSQNHWNKQSVSLRELF